jgi:ATP/maltotriose-dependent transcriptional regulator MalT
LGLADLELTLGDFASAQEQLAEVERLIGDSAEDSGWYLPEVRLVQARSEHLRGRDRQARALLDEAEGLLEATADPALMQRVAALRTDLD